MMHYLHSNSYSLKKTGLLLIVVFLFLTESFAGDITVSLKLRIEVAAEDWEQPIVAEINNLESYPVEGASLNFTIRDKLSLELAYQWSTEFGTVEPQSSVTVKAPNPWIPKVGIYQLRYELSSLNDINPTNDTITYDVEVLPNPGFSLRFNQLNFKNPFQQENSSTGRVDVTIPPNDTNQFLNMTFALPGNTSIAPQWLVQNFPVPAFADEQEISYWIDMERMGVPDGMDVELLRYDFQLSKIPLTGPFFSSRMFLAEMNDGLYDVGGGNPNEWDYGTYLDAPTINWGGEFKVKTWNYRGCTVPNIDLDSSKYNPRDMPGEVGDWNSCSPAAATNSLQWLENTDSNIPKTNLSHREKLKLFNELSGRANEDGLNTGNTIKGKLAYIDSLKLPIHVKWQGIPYDTTIASPNPRYMHSAESKNDSVGAYPTFEWLAAEIEKGEDVEIKFGWYDTMNVRHDGHWVVVSGVSDVTTARGIYVKDDEEQGNAGGMRQTYLNWVTNENGRPKLVGFKGKNNRCWVESVVSESYDSTVTYGIENPKVKKVSVIEGPSGWNDLKGLFEFTFVPSETVRFLNVFASKRGSSDNPTWIVRNLALPPFSEAQNLSAWFDFSWLGFQPEDAVSEIEVGYNLGMDVIDFHVDQFGGSLSRFPVTEDYMNISLNFNNRPAIEGITYTNELRPFKLEPYKTWEYRGCEVPNIDLDSTTYNPTTVDGYAGDKNACGPAGAANSMQWLENKYEEIDTKITHREKLKELSKFMSRADNSTVTDKNFVKGKLAFIDKYKLPIRVKMQGIFFGSDSIPSPDDKYNHFADNKNDTTNAYPKWDWLVSEMKDDEDVEIGIAWYDSLGNPKGGHWVTASGVSEVGSYRGLYIKDDRDQKKAGGMKQQFTNVDTINGGKPYLPQLSSENSICMLEAVVSESYDSTVTFVATYSEDIQSTNMLNLTVYENPGSIYSPLNIDFNLSEPGSVQVHIYEITGRLVYTRELEFSNPGNKTVSWGGIDLNGLRAGSGIYLVNVVTKNISATRKLIRQD